MPYDRAQIMDQAGAIAMTGVFVALIMGVTWRLFVYRRGVQPYGLAEGKHGRAIATIGSAEAMDEIAYTPISEQPCVAWQIEVALGDGTRIYRGGVRFTLREKDSELSAIVDAEHPHRVAPSRFERVEIDGRVHKWLARAAIDPAHVIWIREGGIPPRASVRLRGTLKREIDPTATEESTYRSRRHAERMRIDGEIEIDEIA